NNRLLRMTDLSGAGWTVLGGTLGAGTDQFVNPYGATVDSSGTMYLADTQNDRIARADAMSGLGWAAYGSGGAGVGAFQQPMGVFAVGALAPATSSVSPGAGTPPVARGFAPNPFRGTTRLAFEVPAPGAAVGLDIYDVRGRPVRVLADGRVVA